MSIEAMKIARAWIDGATTGYDAGQVIELLDAALKAAQPSIDDAVKKEREACLDIVESCEVPVGNSPAGELAAEWTMDALRGIAADIRARENAPEYPSTADDEATRWRHGEKL